MKYDRFLKITLQLQKESEVLDKLYESGIDLINFVNPYHIVITELIREVYGDEGYDWWSWFCYENNYGQGELTAYDENGDLICYSFKSLWEHLESIKKK